MSNPCPAHSCVCHGFSLVEVTVAMGIAAFCLVVILGLIPVGSSSNRNSIAQTAAASIARAVYGDVAATPASISSSLIFKLGIASSIAPQTIYLSEDGLTATEVGEQPVTTGSANSYYRVSVAFGGSAQGSRNATNVRILVTWPALADPMPSSWPARYTGSYEINSALDRN
ncbi:MAG: prepilin-type N-terminal cleavage/methylation domain-containing protein [Chthoniobacteraceae bacterium]